jgi:carotenoid cleavage dioxygenase
VFVPASADAAEDEGWLLALEHDRPSDTSRLLVLDARDLAVVARVLLPRRVPHGFHGLWAPDA